MGLKCSLILEKFQILMAHVQGSTDLEIHGLANPTQAEKSDIVFIADQTHLELAKKCPANVLVVSKNLIEPAKTLFPQRTLLSSPNVPLAMALVAKAFFPVTTNKKPFAEQALHPSAVISASAQLGKNVLIGPNVCIGENCQIGDNCIIGANTVVEANVRIGQGTHLHPLVFIGHSTEIGEECEIHPQTSIGTEGYGYAHDEKFNHYRITHYGRVVIEDRVHIGAGVQIDRGTFDESRIGSGTKIDNHCHFGHNIKIGKNCLITGGMIAAGSVTIGDNCIFGGRTSISGHLSIASGCHIAGLSGVTKSVDKPGKYGGYPLVPLNQSLKAISSIAQLPKIRKNLSKVMSAMGISSDSEDKN